MQITLLHRQSAKGNLKNRASAIAAGNKKNELYEKHERPLTTGYLHRRLNRDSSYDLAYGGNRNIATELRSKSTESICRACRGRDLDDCEADRPMTNLAARFVETINLTR